MTSDTTAKIELIHEPGRIDNIDSDQEQKLKDMWAQILLFTGDIPHSLEATPSTLTSHSEDEEKKKKKKRHLFGIGKNKAEAPPKEEKKHTQEANAFKEVMKDLEPAQAAKLIFMMIKADHPDNLLLRFLRARKWVVKDALHMFGNTIYWRHENKVDDILRLGERAAFENNDEEFLTQLRSNKSYIWGHDFRGRPIVHVKTYNHDPKAQGEKSMEDFTLYIIETARLCLKDPVDTAAVFFDLSNFSMANMDYGPVKFMIHCFANHFPECLGFLLIHNAPWVFTGIWNVIKGWIDPVVASKIKFTKTTEDVAKFIPMEYIEKNLGGNSDHTYVYIEPKEGESDLMNDTATRDKLLAAHDELTAKFINATVDWIKSDDKATNQKTQSIKNDIAAQLMENYWQSDPYIRSRGIFDRNGTIDDFKKLHSENWK
ncbi:hypothetical protein DV451_002387 [Geotrichum candidum]|uniref:CRAL-TRIO domain-containing protein n=1 Tax=Geotrichum candidum TaxID=1173061 RepID=A0A9P5G519_GEOCN|nr:hypothetical protein DV451_002387 [Geotrichum candidum]KAF5110800.1 hypothetical protein DV453_000501 [Geotrichum candidum]